MKSLNQVNLIGNLGQDIEVRRTTSGKSVANFSVALGKSWTDDQGQKQEKTTWINCVAWEGLADLAGKYLGKGSKVYLSGALQVREYQDPNKVKKTITEVVVSDLIFLDGAK